MGFTGLPRVFKARCEAVTAELMFPRRAHRKGGVQLQPAS